VASAGIASGSVIEAIRETLAGVHALVRPTRRNRAVRVIVALEHGSRIEAWMTHTGLRPGLIHRIYRRIWSKEELSAVEWFLLRPKWASAVLGADQEDEEWLDRSSCEACCSGARRAKRFYVWASTWREGAFWSSGKGEVFCSEAVRAVLKEAGVAGLEFLEVVDLRGRLVPGRWLVQAPWIAGRMEPASTIGRDVSGPHCDICGRDAWTWAPGGDSIVCYSRGVLKALPLDAASTWEEQGVARCGGEPKARRPSVPYLLVTRRVRRVLREGGLTRRLMMTPVETLSEGPSGTPLGG
jgi:hypothetical protein